MKSKIAKAVGYSLVGLLVLLSLIFNARIALAQYKGALQQSGVNIAIQSIVDAVKKEGEIKLNVTQPDGKVLTVTLVEKK